MRLSPAAIHRASAAAAVPQDLQSAAEGADVFSEQIVQGLDLSRFRAISRGLSEGERAGASSPRQAGPSLLPALPHASFTGGARCDVRAYRVASPTSPRSTEADPLPATWRRRSRPESGGMGSHRRESSGGVAPPCLALLPGEGRWGGAPCPVPWLNRTAYGIRFDLASC
jgi:hypothetical protein